MPKSHKRWTSYELMLKRVKKHAYIVMMRYHATHAYMMPPIFERDRSDAVTIARNREIRAAARAWWADKQGKGLALAMALHPRLGETSVLHGLEEGVLRMIVRETYR